MERMLQMMAASLAERMTCREKTVECCVHPCQTYGFRSVAIGVSFEQDHLLVLLQRFQVFFLNTRQSVTLPRCCLSACLSALSGVHLPGA